jgi:xanthosine utilization system XapX-like protein
MEFLSAFIVGLIPAFLLIVIVAALPSMLLLGYIGLAVAKQIKTALHPTAKPAYHTVEV